MKKTNKCEVCGKRYLLPSYDVTGELREEMCFTCECAMRMMAAVDMTIEQQYGSKYEAFAKTYVDYMIKKGKAIK